MLRSAYLIGVFSLLLLLFYIAFSSIYTQKISDISLDIHSFTIAKSGYLARFNGEEWSKAHGWLHVLSDVGIFLVYISISVSLIIFNRLHNFLRIRNIKYIMYSFAAFIASCGTLHLIDAIMFFEPYYAVFTLAKFFTFIISFIAFLIFINLGGQFKILDNRIIYTFKNEQPKHKTD